MGPNGAGKSTLLKLMTGTLEPLDGMVKRHNHLKIGVYHQHLMELLDPKLTPLEYMVSCFLGPSSCELLPCFDSQAPHSRCRVASGTFTSRKAPCKAGQSTCTPDVMEERTSVKLMCVSVCNSSRSFRRARRWRACARRWGALASQARRRRSPSCSSATAYAAASSSPGLPTRPPTSWPWCFPIPFVLTLNEHCRSCMASAQGTSAYL